MVLAQTTESTNMIICAVQAQRCRCCRRWSYSVPTECQKSGRGGTKKYLDQTACCLNLRGYGSPQIMGQVFSRKTEKIKILGAISDLPGNHSQSGPAFVNSSLIYILYQLDASQHSNQKRFPVCIHFFLFYYDSLYRQKKQ